MKKALLGLAILLLALSFTGCPQPSVFINEVSGEFFKGPYLSGATVTALELDGNLNQTGSSFFGSIISDDGSYNIANVPLSGAIELLANGYFFNEVSGIISSERIDLHAITYQSEVVNVNVLTDIEIMRIRKLVSDGYTLQEAKEQSMKELFAIFHFQEPQGTCDAIELNTENGKALLAISSIITQRQYGSVREVYEIEELMNNIAVDFANDGMIEESLYNTLLKSAYFVNCSQVKQNLENYFSLKNLVKTVPDFKSKIEELLDYGMEYGDYRQINNPNISFFEDAEETLELIQGMSQTQYFYLYDGASLVFTIHDENNAVACYTQYEQVDNDKIVTFNTKGLHVLDFVALHNHLGDEFTISTNVNGITTSATCVITQ